MWHKKPVTEPVQVPDDVAEARQVKARAVAEHNAAVSEGFAISHLVTYLNERRALNHFGDSITISFTRRNRG